MFTLNARVREAVEWYRQAYPLYAQLAQAAAGLTEEALTTAKIPFHSVTWRAKSVASYEKKALTRGFADPRNSIGDMAGVRVITFVQSNTDKACHLITRLFQILETEDKGLQRKAGNFGYRSVHFSARLRPETIQSPQYATFNEMRFEIQVRTLLQHSWAEIEHDRNYKFEGALPPDLQHRFAMLAAVLELVDREFDAISQAIDSYVDAVKTQQAQGNLNIPINTASLRQYLQTRLAPLCPSPLQPRFPTRRDAEEVVRELLGMGIDTLAKLDAAIPADFVAKAKAHLDHTYLSSIVRDILIIHNAEAYFRVTRSAHSQPIGDSSLALYAAYGMDPALIHHHQAAASPQAFWREVSDAR